MAAKIETITDYATYKRVQARLIGEFNTPLKSPEAAEHRMLAEELQRYAHEHFEINQVELDGVDEVVGKLDYTFLTLDELIPVFGGLERFVEYMTRRRNIDAATIDALVTHFGMDRDELEMPFRTGPGDQDISAEGQEPCDNPECCTPGERNWRIELAASMRELTGIGRMTQDILAHPVHSC